MANTVSGNSINQLFNNNTIGKQPQVKNKTKSTSNNESAINKNSIFGTGVGSSATVEFSPEVEMYGKVVDMLQQKYDNADVFVAGPDDDLSQIGGDLEYSIILSEDEMRLLASEDEKDQEAKNKLLGQIDDAMKTISDMSQKIGENTDENDEISNFGISFDKSGKMNFFADINGNSYKDTSIDSILNSLVSDKANK